MNLLLTHAVILPILIPLAAAAAILLLRPAGLRMARAVSLASALALVSAAVLELALASDGEVRVYKLGDWPAPYGIILVLDRVSALMVALTAVIALAALLYAMAGGAARPTDSRGRHFHALFQLQIAGLNGAFLTGDLFNLFVFFEVLLLASYALLAHGGGVERTRIAVAYAVLNMAGSSVFLIALGLIYGTLGTLNLADMALVLEAAPPGDQALVRTAVTLLFVVFLLKAALVPMSFWLPRAYAAAGAPVAVLFTLMTKVGIYAVLRLSVLDAAAGPTTADLLQPWLTPLAIATIVLGTIGALAAARLSMVVANLVLISTGLLLAALAVQTVQASAAALYYLVHTTLVTAGLFLIADIIGRGRGELRDSLKKGPPIANTAAVALAYLVLAVAVSGMPPLSGFLGKLMVMQSLYNTELGFPVWGAILISGLAVSLVLARAASAYFWESTRHEEGTVAARGRPRLLSAGGAALILLVLAGPLLTIAAAPVASFARAAAEQLHAREPYIVAVLGARPEVSRERRP